MTLNNLMVRSQSCWNFGECGVSLHCHRSQVHSSLEWYHLIGSYLNCSFESLLFLHFNCVSLLIWNVLTFKLHTYANWIAWNRTVFDIETLLMLNWIVCISNIIILVIAVFSHYLQLVIICSSICLFIQVFAIFSHYLQLVIICSFISSFILVFAIFSQYLQLVIICSFICSFIQVFAIFSHYLQLVIICSFISSFILVFAIFSHYLHLVIICFSCQ